MTRRGRIPLRETMQRNLSVMRALGVPEDKLAGMERYLPPEPKRRAPRSENPRVPYERDILKAILQALRVHPRVAFAWRMQSGVFQDGDRMIRVGAVGIPDVIGMLGGGQLYAIEVKREGGRLTREQENTLAYIVERGGIAGVARSVEDALALIEGA